MFSLVAIWRTNLKSQNSLEKVEFNPDYRAVHTSASSVPWAVVVSLPEAAQMSGLEAERSVRSHFWEAVRESEAPGSFPANQAASQMETNLTAPLFHQSLGQAAWRVNEMKKSG